MSGELLTEQRANGVISLTLSNIAKKNALDDGMINGLITQLNHFGARKDCRLVLLTGVGEHFCAGRDLGSLAIDELSAEQLEQTFSNLRALAYAFEQFPKPIVSVIEGYCLGLGGAIAAWSDIALSSHTARFGFPEAKVGISPSLTAISLQRTLSAKATKRLLLTGTQISADEAMQIGLITESVDTQALQAATAALIDELLQASPEAQRMCKKLLRDADSQPFNKAIELAMQTTIAAALTSDAAHGRASFKNKRNPSWNH